MAAHANHVYPGLKPMGQPGLRPRTCQFIHGDVPRFPDEPDFCGAPVLNAANGERCSPYCEEHHKDCHTELVFVSTGKGFKLQNLGARG